MKFRDLTADEIEARVQSIKQKDGTPTGAVLLLYKNARCDMNLLDETVGAENWEREHYECKGNLFCRVGINVNYADKTQPREFIYKSDCGTESNTEAQKGEASDSLKRACFNWGIGRELYTSPFIWIPADKCKIYDTNRKDKYGNPIFATNDRFSVEKIIIEDKQIKALAIRNDTQNVRAYVWQE
jgi:hypothetical protein